VPIYGRVVPRGSTGSRWTILCILLFVTGIAAGRHRDERLSARASSQISDTKLRAVPDIPLSPTAVSLMHTPKNEYCITPTASQPATPQPAHPRQAHAHAGGRNAGTSVRASATTTQLSVVGPDRTRLVVNRGVLATRRCAKACSATLYAGASRILSQEFAVLQAPAYLVRMQKAFGQKKAVSVVTEDWVDDSRAPQLFFQWPSSDCGSAFCGVSVFLF
jgi:hypothetical protein